MVKITNEEKVLVASQTLYFFGGSLASVFLSIYLFKLGGFPAVTFFYFLTYFLLVVIYILSGFLLKKTSTKVLLLTALVLFSCFWAILFVLKNSAIDYLFPLGVLFGSAGGFFWSGLNLTQYIVSHQSRRNTYFGWVTAWSNAARGIGPVLGGLVIAAASRSGMDGYSLVFFIVLVLTVVNIGITLYLPQHTGIVFSPGDFFMYSRSRVWKRVLVQQGLLGLWDVSVSNLFGVILFLILKNEFAVGATNAIQSLIAAGGAALAPLLLKNNPKSPVLAGVACGLGLIIFAQLQNIFGLIILTAGTIFAFQIITVPLSSAILNGIDANQVPWQRKYHMLIERDAVLSLARSVSFIFLWVSFSLFPKESVAVVWLTIISVFPVILGFLVVK